MTFRHIEMLNTRKGIYVKVDSSGNSAEVLYQNITLRGHTLQFPVMVGAIHQFTGTSCDWSWPWPVRRPVGSCSANSNQKVRVAIDGLHVIRGGGTNGVPMYRTADFVVIGNDHSDVVVETSNVRIEGPPPVTCDDPPLSRTGTSSTLCSSVRAVTIVVTLLVCEATASAASKLVAMSREAAHCP